MCHSRIISKKLNPKYSQGTPKYSQYTLKDSQHTLKYSQPTLKYSQYTQKWPKRPKMMIFTFSNLKWLVYK